MALITCEECSKEISDRAEKCIHCGFPIKSSHVQKVELTKITSSPKISRLLYVALALALLTWASFFTYTKYQKFSGEKEIVSAAGNMVMENMLYAETLQDKTHAVWKEAIASQYKDFNNELAYFALKTETQKMKENLAAGVKKADEAYQSISKKKSALGDIYDSYVKLYTVYKANAELGTSPHGSFQTYGAEISLKQREMTRATEELGLKINPKKLGEQSFIDWLIEEIVP